MFSSFCSIYTEMKPDLCAPAVADIAKEINTFSLPLTRQQLATFLLLQKQP